MSVTIDCKSASKKIENVLTVETLVARNAKADMVESVFGGSLESGGRFCVCAFDRNLASDTAILFSQFYKEIL
jgi:hypothetical protein